MLNGPEETFPLSVFWSGTKLSLILLSVLRPLLRVFNLPTISFFRFHYLFFFLLLLTTNTLENNAKVKLLYNSSYYSRFV